MGIWAPPIIPRTVQTHLIGSRRVKLTGMGCPIPMYFNWDGYGHGLGAARFPNSQLTEKKNRAKYYEILDIM